jgi:hypothetical protein
MQNKNRIIFFVAFGIGLFITYIDTLPSWDDTGITASMVFGAALVLSFISPKKFWLWALLLSAWIPLYSLFVTHNYSSILALLIGFIGAYAGAIISAFFKKDIKQ